MQTRVICSCACMFLSATLSSKHQHLFLSQQATKNMSAKRTFLPSFFSLHKVWPMSPVVQTVSIFLLDIEKKTPAPKFFQAHQQAASLQLALCTQFNASTLCNSRSLSTGKSGSPRPIVDSSNMLCRIEMSAFIRAVLFISKFRPIGGVLAEVFSVSTNFDDSARRKL